MTYCSGNYQYELVDNWAKLPQGRSFLDIGGMAVDAQDRVYIFNRSPHPLMIFEKNGDFAGGWGEGYFSRPHGTRISPDRAIYFTDDIDQLVSKFTLEGKLLMTLGEKGKASDTGYVANPDLMTSLKTIKRGAGPFNRPTGIGVSSTGDIFISDGYGNAQVHKFSADGKYLFSWGGPGTGESEFMLPHNVWIDREDRVWIPDRENSRVQIFNSDGKFLSQWTDVSRPTDVVIDDDDVVYISELGDETGVGPGVSLHTINGELITRWGNKAVDHETDMFLAPHALTVDSAGDIYVGEVAMTHAGFDRGGRVVQKFARVE